MIYETACAVYLTPKNKMKLLKVYKCMPRDSIQYEYQNDLEWFLRVSKNRPTMLIFKRPERVPGLGYGQRVKGSLRDLATAIAIPIAAFIMIGVCAHYGALKKEEAFKKEPKFNIYNGSDSNV